MGMTAPVVVILGLQAVIFGAWAFQGFRCLIRLRADAVAASGHVWPGPAASLRAFRGFIMLPKYARDRQILLWLTVLLFALTGAFVALASDPVAR
jgi:hypothetical protein